MQSAMVATIVRAMIVMPELGPVYFYGFCAGKYLKDMRSKVNERFDKISKGHDEKCSIHTKLSFSGRQVIKIYNKSKDFTKILLDFCQNELILSRARRGKDGRNDWFERLINFPTEFLFIVFCIHFRNTVDPVVLLLVLQRATWVTGQTGEIFRNSTEVKKRMKKVQKLIMLENIKQEFTENPVKVEESWPHAGRIQFKDFQLRYRPNTDLVLKSLSLDIKAGDKVGIVGRTGAGKSTIGLTLLRIMEGEAGCILIDGVDISKVELQTLREKITTIPQDPAIFKGTLSFNIDPFGKESEEVIDNLLDRSGLAELVLKGEKKDKKEIREYAIEEGGSNLSAGEKQLVCICRAVIRKAKIVIFDEATANIDVMTEHKIMELIAKDFANATVITIAHRMNTIINSDKIAVMSHGRLLEYASPKTLLQNPKSEFAKLLNELKKTEDNNP